MLTKMTEEDWVLVHEVFRCLAARGVGTRGETTASFSEALHYFTIHNISHGRALPAEFGSWNSIWKRFWRLSHGGVFETFFRRRLASLEQGERISCRCSNSTVIRAHVSGGRRKGKDGGDLERSKEGSRPDPSQDRSRRLSDRLPSDRRRRSDSATSKCSSTWSGRRYLPLSRTGYDAKTNREAARNRGIVRSSYPLEHHRQAKFFAGDFSTKRGRVSEQMMGKIKRFKRIRCERRQETMPHSSPLVCKNHLDQIRPHGLASPRHDRKQPLLAQCDNAVTGDQTRCRFAALAKLCEVELRLPLRSRKPDAGIMSNSASGRWNDSRIGGRLGSRVPRAAASACP